MSAVDVGRKRAEHLPSPEPHVIVLFGATGDLARRKLIPGLFHLGQAGLLPDEFRIVGTSLDDLGDSSSAPTPAARSTSSAATGSPRRSGRRSGRA